jgi:hypothetical protein
MAKNKISEFSSTPANNTDIGGINIAEGCAPSGINNAIRELMAQLKDQQAGTDSDNFTVGGGFTCAGAAVFSSTVAISGSATAPTPSAGDSSTKIATTAFLASMYPVGSIYTSTVSTNPNTLFGFGTWVAFGAGRVMVGNGGGFTAGATGGSADAIVVSHTHTGTTVSAGSHSHSTKFGNQTGGNNFFGEARNNNLGTLAASAMDVAGDHTHSFTTDATGSSGTNANLQPYIVVYMWNRTA